MTSWHLMEAIVAGTGLKLGTTVTLALCLAACGGGGGGSGAGLTSTPAPPLGRPPSAVDIFASPASQEFATIGSGDDLRIRYDAASNKYEVMAENQGWGTLVDDPNFTPQAGNPNTNFLISGFSQSHFLIRAHRSFNVPDVRYSYSNLAAWGGAGLGGYVAFGMATPSGSVPVTGSATYNGMIEGKATDTVFDNLAGQVVPGGIKGSIELAFNFGAGSLSGSINPTLDLNQDFSLGTLSFTDTVYSTGSGNFSGRFNTNLAGNNSFGGLLTGPNAQELIGRFAFPYISPVTGTPKQAEGAFIAKR